MNSNCKKDFTNSGAASETQVFTSTAGLTDVAIGLQNWYSTNRSGLVYNTISTDALLTKQLYVVNAGNTDEAQLGQGFSSILNTNGMVTTTWSVANKIIYDANNIIINAPIVVTDESYRASLIGYSSIFKALAIGTLSSFWENIPDTTGTNVNFISNTLGFQKAINTIDNAISQVEANGISSSFTSRIPTGIDILNTLYALKARYSLYIGDYNTALKTANKVDLTSKSVFNYTTAIPNPVFNLATSTNNIYQPIDSTMGLPSGLQPDLNDKRESFYISISSNPRFRINGFFNLVSAAVPLYLPGEIILIKAECYVRLNDLTNGLIYLNQILVKTPSNDPFGVGANLSATTIATQTEILDQIYKNRCLELYMSGLKLVDERRFQRATNERLATYLPYPYVERNANTNTPTDPTE